MVVRNMLIKVSDTLPATGTLNSENIFVMTETRALKQEIRPLEIVILNLMPKKIETETSSQSSWKYAASD